MASQANVYASVAGTVGRSDKDPGAVGVFRRPAETGVWEHVLGEFSSNVVHVHPTDPNIVFAGTHDGVYRSTDRGKTFKRANFPDKGMEIWSFLVDAGNPKLVYAGGSPVAVYRSEDSGETWRRLPDPNMPTRCVMPFACRVMRMAQHPSKPGTIFAALEVGGVMRTTDGGETWKDCSPALVQLAQKPHLKSKIVSDTSDEGMLDGHAIAISPADPDAVIVAVRMGLFRTADDGDTWQDMEVGRFSPTTYGRDIKASLRRTRYDLFGAERRRGEQGRRGLSQQGQGKDLAAVRQGAGARHDHVGGAASERPEAGVYRRALRRRGVRHAGWRRDLAVDEPAVWHEGHLLARLRLITRDREAWYWAPEWAGGKRLAFPESAKRDRQHRIEPHEHAWLDAENRDAGCQ